MEGRQRSDLRSGRALASDGFELDLELGDGLERLGQLVGLEALDATGAADIDHGLALPPVEGRFGDPELLGQRAHLFAGHQTLTDRPAELSRIALGHGLPPGSSRPNSYNAGSGLGGKPTQCA
ncbi:MAG TPA: hypothetical protein VMS00_02600 [Acidimicrobiales bacterium]|nr:hypothetical protein [Acidimicrobiales bacterium]